MNSKIDWNDLTYLVALDRYGGLKKAADHLGTSHQTAARKLKALEQSLGIRLADSTGRRWTLTNKGREILAVANQMEEKAEEILRLSNTEAENYSGRVGISSVSWGMELIIMPALKKVQAKYPDLWFELISDDGIQSIEAGDVDLALRFTSSPPLDLIGSEIGPVLLGIYGVQSHANAYKAGRYEEITLIQLKHQVAHRVPWHEREDASKRVILVNDLQTMLLAVREGLGVAVLPTVVASKEKSLVRIKSEPIAARSSAWILRHQESRKSNKVKAVEAAIAAIAKSIFAASRVSSPDIEP